MAIRQNPEKASDQGITLIHFINAYEITWGALTWKVVRGCATLKTPFFWPYFSFRDPPFQAHFQLQRPTSIFLKKVLHFETIFLLNLTKFQLLKHIFEQKYLPKTPVSDPIFQNLGGTYLPKFLSTTSTGNNIWWLVEGKTTQQIGTCYAHYHLYFCTAIFVHLLKSNK